MLVDTRTGDMNERPIQKLFGISSQPDLMSDVMPISLDTQQFACLQLRSKFGSRAGCMDRAEMDFTLFDGTPYCQAGPGNQWCNECRLVKPERWHPSANMQ